MCGISGFSSGAGRAVLQRMTDALKHRGPDDEGLWIDERSAVGLGHRRLSIVDMAGGSQPMWSADGSVAIVFNGEIYNHLSIRSELEREGVRFHSDHSDTETILQSYMFWGENCTARLEGMWSFLIYDSVRNHFFASRDRFGEKPFFYVVHGGHFIFASELGSLAEHPAVSRQIGIKELQKYFAYGYFPRETTILQDVRQLLPGHQLVWSLDSRTLAIRPYWSISQLPHDQCISISEDEAIEEILNKLGKSVRERFMSDVPLGLFLSGGIDSSLALALAREEYPGDSLNTFTIGFDDDSFDESGAALSTAEHFRSIHHEKIIRGEDLPDLASSIPSMLDMPLGDSSILPTTVLARFAREQVTVALSGDGGDELFMGYDPFRAVLPAQIVHAFTNRLIHPVIEALAGFLPVSHSRMSLDFKIKRGLAGALYPPSYWAPVWMAPLLPREIEEMLGTPVSFEDLFSEAIQVWDAAKGKTTLEKMVDYFLKIYLPGSVLTKVDRASMMVGLESRAVFLSRDLAEFSLSLPVTMKFKRGRSKALLRKAAARVLPDAIARRPKMGFGMPIGSWMEQGRLSLDESALAQFPGRSYTLKRLNEHRDRVRDDRLFLWSAWVLNEWSKKREGLRYVA